MFLHVTCAWLHFTFTPWSKSPMWSDVIQQYMQASSLLISKVTRGGVWCGISSGQSWQADIINLLRVGECDMLVYVGGMVGWMLDDQTPTYTQNQNMRSKQSNCMCTQVHTDTHTWTHTRTHIHTHSCTHRVRPQNAREQIDMCRMCTFCTPDQPHIVLGKDKAFTYDYVFDTATEQHHLYDTCVEELVSGWVCALVGAVGTVGYSMCRCFLCVFPVVNFVCGLAMFTDLANYYCVLLLCLAGVLKVSTQLCLPMDRWVGPSTVVIVICPATTDMNLIVKWPEWNMILCALIVSCNSTPVICRLFQQPPLDFWNGV
jgi:hypothetical protein